MKKILISSFAASVFLFTVSCKSDFETDVSDVVVTSGTANFSKYIALGNSLTSGYRDNALYIDGQNQSFPSMIAAQMQFAGGGAFKQPLMADNLGGIPSVGIGNKLVLSVVNNALAPVPAAGTGATTLANIFAQGPYQNMGVPGAKSFHLGAAGYGNVAGLALGQANPYFVRFSSSPTASVIGDAVAQAPTFFSLWIGNNDVLSYATNGGTNSSTLNGVTTITPAVYQAGNTNPATYRSNDITDPNVVAGTITNYVNALTANGAKGVIANIPNVTTIPFFTTVPYNPLTPALIGANVPALNAGLYGPLKQALTAFNQGNRINLLSATENNPLLIVDVSLANLSAQLTAALTPSLGPQTAAAFGQIYGQARQATAEDFVLLTTRSQIGAVVAGAPPTINLNGISFPLANQFILTKDEVAKVTTATNAYNTAIKALATTKNLAFVDANAKLRQLATVSGIQYNGVRFSATFVTGGTFSLDGVHLTGRGYALIANEFITQINAQYGSTLPQVNVNSFSGVTFP